MNKGGSCCHMVSPLQRSLGCVLAGKQFSLPQQGRGLCGRPVSWVHAAGRDLFFGTASIPQGAIDCRDSGPSPFPDGPILSNRGFFRDEWSRFSFPTWLVIFARGSIIPSPGGTEGKCRMRLVQMPVTASRMEKEPTIS